MIDDNLTQQKLKKMIGAQRFETKEDFKDYLKPLLADALVVPKDHIKEESERDEKDDNRFDLFIYDKAAEHELLLIIGLKTEKDVPHFSDNDMDAFRSYCRYTKAHYGVLMNESEYHFYQINKGEAATDIVEIDKLPPLNYVEYEAEKEMGSKELIYKILLHKWVFIGFSIFVLMLLFLSLYRSVHCRTSGLIKTNIDKDGIGTYYLPDSKEYDKIETGDVPGERHFCNESEAVELGWKKSQ